MELNKDYEDYEQFDKDQEKEINIYLLHLFFYLLDFVY